MIFTLYKQKPKTPKAGIAGKLAVHDKTAWLFDSADLVAAELRKPEIIMINQDGIMLRGFEPIGYTSTGVEKFMYQEWLLRWG